MRVLLASDVFPPRCGGAGWSSYYLARALAQRGHIVEVVVLREGVGHPREREYGGLRVHEFPYWAPRIPFLRNLFRNERLWPRLADWLVEKTRADGFQILHAQHSQTVPAAVRAGRRLGIPVVATVRDYWPLCYRATGLSGDGTSCTRCSLRAAVRCFGTSAVLPAYPYIRSNVARKAKALAEADAVIAVSRFVARQLGDIVRASRLHVIPNLVDLEEVDRIASAPEPEAEVPFILFVGKLEPNKGVRELLTALRRAAERLGETERPALCVGGDGSLREYLERGLADIGWPARFLRWADHDRILRLLKRTELLLFPSRWEEPLSRVLLEACACGAPILAMATGGTTELFTDGVDAALVPAAAEPFARRLVALLKVPEERRRLGAGARRLAEERLSAPVVVAQVEALYCRLVPD
ncbi:MAG: glycosyltransferase family 4 protein [Chloroflexia bacterium]